MRGLYVHIPFCKSKCFYCDFYSLPDSLQFIGDFVQALLQESSKYSGLTFNTVYFGGGTPSLLDKNQLIQLIQGFHRHFNFPSIKAKVQGVDSPALLGDEATIEINPESASQEFLDAAFQAGFSRISLGVQSLIDQELQAAGRIHSVSQALTAIKKATRAGFSNISADVIIGLPGQNWKTLTYTLDTLIDHDIQHISAYCLDLDNATPMALYPPGNLPSDGEQVDLFYRTREKLLSRGYIHYEISNFTLPGYESRHNLIYWRGQEYLGLGPAAASHLEGIRFKNKPDINSYLQRPTGSTIEVEQLDVIHKAEEETVLRLRLLKEGVDAALLSAKYGKNNVFKIGNKLESLADSGYLLNTGSIFRLPPKYILISNRIFSQLISAY